LTDHGGVQPVAALARKSINRALLLDIVERTIVCGWYGMFAYQFLMTFLHTHNPVTLLLVVSEGSVVAFTLFRRLTTTISVKPIDWLLAVGGTVAPLCAHPAGGTALLPAMLYILVMLSGLGVQIWAKLTLRRRFGIVAANRGVQASGPYRFVRHPMYLGYTLTEIGFFLSNASPWNAIIYTMAFAFQVARLLVEERYLSQDPAYRAFKTVVRFRLIPGVF
jgi:protein-S-isoprenylcysteine O-methyltransferase Ste14